MKRLDTITYQELNDTINDTVDSVLDLHLNPEGHNVDDEDLLMFYDLRYANNFHIDTACEIIFEKLYDEGYTFGRMCESEATDMMNRIEKWVEGIVNPIIQGLEHDETFNEEELTTD